MIAGRSATPPGGHPDEMVAAAAKRRYAYLAVTGHAPNLYMQRMSDEKMLAQRAELQALDRRYPKLRLLHGTELNIDPDGGVDWPPEFLARFDLCVASVHSHFTQSRKELTRRLVRACENPLVNIIGHPTGRLIRRRPAVRPRQAAPARCTTRSSGAVSRAA